MLNLSRGQAFAFVRFKRQILGVNNVSSRKIFNFFKKKMDQPEENFRETSEIDLLWKSSSDLLSTRKNKNKFQLSISAEKALKKAQFLEVIDLYLIRFGHNKRGFNEFAQKAHSQMIQYDVHKDLACYKAILQVFPKGELVHASYLMAEMTQFKKQQDTVLAMILDMRRYNVLPDDAFGQQIIDIFGYRSLTMNLYRQAMYWMPKLYYQNPFPVADRLPTDYDTNPAYIAQLAAHRMSVDKMTMYHHVYLSANERTEDQPWCLVSAQSPKQQMLISALCQKVHDSEKQACIFLDGPQFVYYKELQLAYYTLWMETDANRLEEEFTDFKSNEKLHKEIQEGTWQYQLYGFNDEEDIKQLPIPDMPKTQTRRQLTSEDLATGLVAVDENQDDKVVVSTKKLRVLGEKIFLPDVKKIPGIVYPEPEFDDRWVALRSLHKPVYLPKRLFEAHEQVEGSILAIGVVGPTREALINQKIVQEYESTNKRVLDCHKDSIDFTGVYDDRPSSIPTVPSPAPSSLIKSWLKELRVKNPGLDKITLIVRTQDQPEEEPDKENHQMAG